MAIESGNWNAAGVWRASEAPFSVDEYQAAMTLRQSTIPFPWLKRRDLCPHALACGNVTECVERIAWYLRHRRTIEGLTDDNQ